VDSAFFIYLKFIKLGLFNKKQIFYKTPAEIEIMREAAQIVSRTLGILAAEIKPGVTPLFLDKIAEELNKILSIKPSSTAFNPTIGKEIRAR
jgi:methionine aminopeptidase